MGIYTLFKLILAHSVAPMKMLIAQFEGNYCLDAYITPLCLFSLLILYKSI